MSTAQLSASSTILFIEDDPDDIFLFQHALERAPIPCNVQTVTSVIEAEAYLAGAGPYFDRQKFPVPALIITDLGFRGDNGLDFLHWLREQSAFPAIPVICVSGTDHPAKLEQARNFGATCIRKSPFFEDLLATLQKMLVS